MSAMAAATQRAQLLGRPRGCGAAAAPWEFERLGSALQRPGEVPSPWAARGPRCEPGGAAVAGGLAALAHGSGRRLRRRQKVVRLAGTGLAYTWEEGGAAGNEVRVYIPLAASVGLRDVNVSLSQQRIRVDVAGRGTVLEGHLWRAVDVEESMWVIEEHKGQRSVVVSLDKEATWERWEHLLKRSGIPGCGYSWEQSGRFNEEVRIHIPVSEGVTAKDVELEVAERGIRLALLPRAAPAGEEEEAPAEAPGPGPVLEGTLWGEVDMKEGASWMFEERGGQRCITVTLEKVHVRESWERLLERDPHREGSAGCGSLESEPGTRKDVDISVLGSLEQVEYYLQQRRVDEAQELMDIMTREIDDELPDL